MSFVSVMKHIGHDLKVGFEHVLPIAATYGSAVVSTFFPGAGALFNGTVSAVLLAEQKYAALGKEKMGPQKLADVMSLMEPIIANGLHDAGLDNSSAKVIEYINAIVTILNTTHIDPSVPAPVNL